MATRIIIYSWQWKRILVTGAGKGIGRDICERLYHDGAIVYILSRTKLHLVDLKAKCPTINILVVDWENWDQARSAVESIRIGPVDAVVNNAGALNFGSMLDCKVEDYERYIFIKS